MIGEEKRTGQGRRCLIMMRNEYHQSTRRLVDYSLTAAFQGMHLNKQLALLPICEGRHTWHTTWHWQGDGSCSKAKPFRSS